MIPKITIEYFQDVYIEHISDVLRISKDEFKEKLENDSTFSLNKKAERFVRTYLRNDIENLTDDNWLELKEIFIQWKLFEGIELEKESLDKKLTLFELLNQYKTTEENSNNREAKKIVVV